jgi:hypothetical protein
MSVEKLRRVKRVVSHLSCPDGKGAAMVAAWALAKAGAEFEVEFVQYGHREFEQMEARDGDLFVDITPPVARWEEWKGKDVTVLDHHPTVQHVVEGLGGTFGGLEESGASLAFEHVAKVLVPDGVSDHWRGGNWDQPLTVWGEMARLCAVRDTWRRKDADWRNACALAEYLMFHSSIDLVKAAREDTVDFQEMMGLGKKLAKRSYTTARLVASGAMLEYLPGVPGGRDLLVGVFNCTDNSISDAASMLTDAGVDLAVGFFVHVQDGAPAGVVSLRSQGAVTVNVLAKSMGGGGHAAAAGFRIPGNSISIRHVMDTVKDLVQDHPETVSPELTSTAATVQQVREATSMGKRKD